MEQWKCSSPCHGEGRGFESRRSRFTPMLMDLALALRRLDAVVRFHSWAWVCGVTVSPPGCGPGRPGSIPGRPLLRVVCSGSKRGFDPRRLGSNPRPAFHGAVAMAASEIPNLASLGSIPSCPASLSDGGRRARPRSWCRKRRVGSNPTSGTSGRGETR